MGAWRKGGGGGGGGEVEEGGGGEGKKTDEGEEQEVEEGRKEGEKRNTQLVKLFHSRSEAVITIIQPTAKWTALDLKANSLVCISQDSLANPSLVSHS